MKENKPIKNIWVILSLVFFFPLGLILMWAKTNWNNKTKWVVTAVIGVFMLISIVNGNATPSSTSSNTNSQSIKSQPTAKQAPDAAKPVVPTVAFDKNIGNNQVAAKEAQNIQQSFDKTIPGLIKSVYINCDPQDLGGKSEHDYEKSILQAANITITVDADMWSNSMTDSLKKDFVAGLIKTVKTNINVYPSITVSDGFRTVATGNWSVWNGEVSITLK